MEEFMSYTDGIGGLNPALNPVVGATDTQRSIPAKPAGNDPAAPEPQADDARLSAAGELINQTFGASDVRADKVEALQKAIASGSYSVSSSEVADKLIQSMLD
jgi:negative regulator of flagellin synthesis FlgM